jgi:hypothetical protein
VGAAQLGHAVVLAVGLTSSPLAAAHTLASIVEDRRTRAVLPRRCCIPASQRVVKPRRDSELDHDTDSYEKISRAFLDGQPAGKLTRDHILDNITAYWLTGTGASAARWYWELGRAHALAAGQAPPEVSIPLGFTTFPGEIFRAPRGSMPAQTTNLFLLEDLEDVRRTSELAESDREALHAVADWIKTFVVKPHKDLGRGSYSM